MEVCDTHATYYATKYSSRGFLRCATNLHLQAFKDGIKRITADN